MVLCFRHYRTIPILSFLTPHTVPVRCTGGCGRVGTILTGDTSFRKLPLPQRPRCSHYQTATRLPARTKPRTKSGRHHDDHPQRHNRTAIPPRTPQRPPHRRHHRSRLGTRIPSTLYDVGGAKGYPSVCLHICHVIHFPSGWMVHWITRKENFKI